MTVSPVLQELQARQASERLAQRLHIRVGAFNPEGAATAATTYPFYVGHANRLALLKCIAVAAPVIVRSPFGAKHHVVVQYMASWMKCPLPPPLQPLPGSPPHGLHNLWKTRSTRKNRRHYRQGTSHCSCLEHCFLFVLCCILDTKDISAAMQQRARHETACLLWCVQHEGVSYTRVNTAKTSLPSPKDTDTENQKKRLTQKTATARSITQTEPEVQVTTPYNVAHERPCRTAGQL